MTRRRGADPDVRSTIELAACLDRLEFRVAALERRRPADRDDDGLLLAVARAVEDRVFTVVDLRAHARVDEALAKAFRDSDLATAREIAWWLRTLRGRAIAGLQVEKIKRTRDGGLWQIVPVLHDAHEAPEPLRRPSGRAHPAKP